MVGCDVAKHTDWTVLIAMDAETGRCFAMERFNHLDWPIQKERILGFVRRWRGRLVLDASGVGDPIYDDLKRVYPDVEGFKFTAHSKVELVQRLIVAVEQRRVSWPGYARGATPGQAGGRVSRGGAECAESSPPASLEARRHGGEETLEKRHEVAGIVPISIGAIPATVVSGRETGASVSQRLRGDSAGSQ